MHDPVTTSYLRYQPMLVLWLRSSFPGACPELAVDATQDTYVVALERPELFERALSRSEGDLRRLLRTVAWRRMRAMICRGARRLEQEALGDELPALAVPPGQEHAAGLGERVRWLMESATRAYGGERGPALRLALEEKVLTGSPDQELARKHEIPREYLNRAKRHVQRGVWDVALCA